MMAAQSVNYWNSRRPRKFVLGDAHGGAKALQQVLNRAEFDYENDELISLGDIADGWSETYQCVEILLKIKNGIFIRGNHDCFHKDTEYLTDQGWLDYKSILEDPKIKLAEFDEYKQINFSIPLAYVSGHSKKLIKIEGTDSCQVVTHGHDVIIGGFKIKAKDLLHSDIRDRDIPIHGDLKGSLSGQEGVTPDMVKLITWLVCDGTLLNYNTKQGQIITKRIQFKLSKPHKIEALEALLNKCGLSYTKRQVVKEGLNQLQPYVICVYTKEARKVTDLLDSNKKKFPNWFKYLKGEFLDAVLEGLAETDAFSSEKSKHNFNLISVNKKDLDILQILFLSNNIPSYLKVMGETSGFTNGKTQYKLNFKLNDPSRLFKVQVEEVEYNDYHHCFEMPKGNLITRFNGKIAFTGNCTFNQWLKTGSHPYNWDQGAYETLKSYCTAIGFNLKAQKTTDKDGMGREIEQYLVNAIPEIIPQEHVKFFKNQIKYYVDEDNNIFVHAGFNRHIPFKEQSEDIYYWDRKLWNEALSSRSSQKGMRFVEPNINEIFIGHTATTAWGIDHPIKADRIWNMDTGGGFNGRLSLMNIDTKELYQSDPVMELYPDEMGRYKKRKVKVLPNNI